MDKNNSGKLKNGEAYKFGSDILCPVSSCAPDKWRESIGKIYGTAGEQMYDVIAGISGNPYASESEFDLELARMDKEVIENIAATYSVSLPEAVIIYQKGNIIASDAISEIVSTVMPQEFIDAFQIRNEAVGATRRPSEQYLRFVAPIDALGEFEINRLHFFAQYGKDVAALQLKNDFPGQLMRAIDHMDRYIFDLTQGAPVSRVREFHVIHNNSDNAASGVYEQGVDTIGNDQHLKKYYMAMRQIEGVDCAVHPSLKSDSSALIKAFEKGGVSRIQDFVRMMLVVDGGKAARDEIAEKLKYSFIHSSNYDTPVDDNGNDGRGHASGTVDWARFKIAEADCDIPMEIAVMDKLAYFNYRNKISDGRDKAWRLYGFDRVVGVYSKIFPDEFYRIDGIPTDEILRINRNSIIADLRNSRVSRLTGKTEILNLVDSMGVRES